MGSQRQIRPGKQATRGALLAVAMALLLPTLFKPFHIDDPVVLAVAEQILQNPLSPMAGRLDWFGTRLPLWEVTTNPPLLSYYLAVPLAWFGYSETWLHLALFPFLLLLAYSTWWLARRICERPWPALLLALGSPAVVVSINLMRDVPAVALVTAAAMLVVRGVDGKDGRMVAAAGFTLGLATLTKYSAAVLLPVFMFYPWSRGRPLLALTVAVGVAPLALWSLWTWIVYGASHPLFLIFGDHPGGAMTVTDNFFAALAVIGASLPAVPVFELRLLKSRRRLYLVGIGVSLVAGAASAAYHGTGPSQFSVWVVLGMLVLILTLSSAMIRLWRCGWNDSETGFLLVWLLASFLFSVVFVPFQAVRHLIPALLPVVLLAMQTHPRDSGAWPGGLIWCAGALQAVLALGVATADFKYAECYRDAAQQISRSERGKESQVWFVGHWGWQVYAEQAGMRQLHADGPPPQPGDLLVWPRRVHIGNVFSGHPGLRKSLLPIAEFSCDSALPLRTMNFEGAAFYAVIRGNAPYAFQEATLETFRVYRLGGL